MVKHTLMINGVQGPFPTELFQRGIVVTQAPPRFPGMFYKCELCDTGSNNTLEGLEMHINSKKHKAAEKNHSIAARPGTTTAVASCVVEAKPQATAGSSDGSTGSTAQPAPQETRSTAGWQEGSTGSTAHPAPEEARLPAGWVEGFDEKSCRKYFYNAQGSQWERPQPAQSFVAAVAAVASATPSAATNTAIASGAVVGGAGGGGQKREIAQAAAIADSLPHLPALPKGWSEGFDKASSCTFYHNTEGASQWERPGVALANPAAANPVVLPSAGAEFAAGTVCTPIASASGGGAVSKLVASAGLESMAIWGLIASGSQAALPKGWSEELDKGSGRTFYYNSDGVSQWERPSATPASPASTRPVVALANLQSAGSEFAAGTVSKPVASASVATGGVAEAVEAAWAQGGGRGTVPSNDSQVMRPVSASVTGDGSVEAVEAAWASLAEEVDDAQPWWTMPGNGGGGASASAAGPGSVEAARAQGGGLPPGWRAEWDDTSAQPYYADLETGTTQWEPPPPHAPGDWSRHFDQSDSAYWESRRLNLRFYEHASGPWSRRRERKERGCRVYWSSGSELGTIRFFED